MRRGLAVVTAALVLALAAYAWRGWYARYERDDYCTASAVRNHGVVGTVMQFRETWSGRFSYFAAKGVVESAGRWTVRYTPGVLIMAFVAAAASALRRCAVGASLALLGATAIVFATFHGTPDLLAAGGPLVWETGSITYTLPLILLTLWLALLAAGGRAHWRWAGSAMLAFLAGGLSETSLAAQGAMMTVLFITCCWRRDRSRMRTAAAGLAGTAGALILVASAAGNLERMDTAPPREAILVVAADSVQIAASYFGSHAFVHGAALLLILLAGSIVGTLSESIRPSSALTVAAAACAGYAGSFLPARWMLSNAPPDRALIVPQFLLVLMIGALAVAFNRWQAERRERRLAMDVAALLLAAAIPLVAAVSTVRTIPRARAERAETERIVRALQRGGDVVVRSPWALETSFASGSPVHWVNQCMASYFGARSLRVRE